MQAVYAIKSDVYYTVAGQKIRSKPNNVNIRIFRKILKSYRGGFTEYTKARVCVLRSQCIGHTHPAYRTEVK